MEENKQPKFEGWRDTNIDDNISLGGIVQLLNIFNQRLILIEDQLKVKVGNEEEHTEMTLTQYWIEIQKQEYQKMLEEMKKQKEDKENKANKANEEQNKQ